MRGFNDFIDLLDGATFCYREPEIVRYEDIDSVLSDLEKEVEQACITLYKESLPRKLDDDCYINAFDIWQAMGYESFPISNVVADIENAMDRMGNIEVKVESGTRGSDDYFYCIGSLLCHTKREFLKENETVCVEWNLHEPFRTLTIEEKKKRWEEAEKEIKENE